MRRRFSVTIPARINILGNPTDGNEGDFATISAAIDLFAGAVVSPAKSMTLQFLAGPKSRRPEATTVVRLSEAIGLREGDPFRLVKAPLRGLVSLFPALAARIRKEPVCIGLWTDVPRQSGLGGSSLLILLVLNALRVAYELSPDALNDYVLAELTQRLEDQDLGITCGFSDRYVPQLGGLAYVDYRGKLYHRALFEEPFATYERLDAYRRRLSFLVVFTGVARDSGDVHSVLRSRYLTEHLKKETDPHHESSFLDSFRRIGELAWQGKIALLRNDVPAFGRLMDENHRLIDDIMRECNFPSGAGERNNAIIAAAREAGALGAKLTGAGGGGCVLVLAEPGRVLGLKGRIEKMMAKYGISDGRIFPVSIVPQGVRVQRAGRRVR